MNVRFDKTTAKAAGRRSATARRGLDLARVERELGPLVGPEDVQRRLDRLTAWSAAGMMASGAAGAAVRACEVWLRAHEAVAVLGQLRAAEKTIKALQAALRDAQTTGGLRRGERGA